MRHEFVAPAWRELHVVVAKQHMAATRLFEAAISSRRRTQILAQFDYANVSLVTEPFKASIGAAVIHDDEFNRSVGVFA